MEIWSVTSTALAALAVLTLPGLPITVALRTRPMLQAAVLAPLSLALIAASAELGSLVGVPWNPVTPVALGVLLGGLLWLPGRRLAADKGDEATYSSPSSRVSSSAILAGIFVGGGLLLVQALRIMGSINAVNQTFDNIFHLNAIRHILRAENGSAWVVGGMTRFEEGYYPAAWHQATSLVVQLSGQDLVLSSNILMLLVAAFIWPVGVVALVRVTTAVGPAGLFLAGALAGISAAFPLTLIGWGIVLPYLLSMSMMPVVVLLAVSIVDHVPAEVPRIGFLRLAVLIPGCLTAVCVAHPQGAYVGMVLCVPILLWAAGARIADRIRRRPGTTTHLVVTVTLAVLSLTVMLLTWTQFRPAQSSSIWRPNTTRLGALGQVVSLSPNATLTWEPFGVLMLIAIASVLIWSRSRWLVASWATAVALAIISRSEPVGDLRYLFTGIWYSDNNRISAIPIIVAVPLLAVGLDALLRRAAQKWTSLQGKPEAAMAAAMAVILITMSVLSPSNQVSMNYQVNDWQRENLLSADERELLERLPEVVPDDALIATNALNGSALAYAISDRPVLNKHVVFQAEPEVHLLNARLDDARFDPEVCDVVHDLEVEYALDFGPREVLENHRATYTGLNEISETGAAEVVLQVGEAKLLRMLPCRGLDGQMNY